MSMDERQGYGNGIGSFFESLHDRAYCLIRWELFRETIMGRL